VLKGLDVSSYQGVIPWAQTAEGLDLRFAIVKTAEGMSVAPDVKAKANVEGARAAGLVVGGYFFLHPQAALKPEAQAELHFKLATDCGLHHVGDLPPFVDLEIPLPTSWSNVGFTPSSLRAWTTDYLSALHSLWGMTPSLYSYPDFLMQLGVGGDPSFAAYPLWIASYVEKAWPIDGQRPLLPRPWVAWQFWQWSSQVRLVTGVTCDADVFWGGETDLQAILQKPYATGAILDRS
jgi:lysozyme